MNDKDTITCTINGKEYTFPQGTTLMKFLEEKTIHPKSVVVEYNGEVLPKGEYEFELADGDTLEVVQVIGGG